MLDLSQWYKLISVAEEKYYSLGTVSQAIKNLPRLLDELKDSEAVILYGDDQYTDVADKYEETLQFEKVDYAYGEIGKGNTLIDMDKFHAIFYQNGGIELTVKTLRSTL